MRTKNNFFLIEHTGEQTKTIKQGKYDSDADAYYEMLDNFLGFKRTPSIFTETMESKTHEVTSMNSYKIKHGKKLPNKYYTIEEQWSDERVVCWIIYPKKSKAEKPKATKPTTKKSNEEKPLHITIYIGKFRVYRVFRTCETLHKYIQAILNKGYHAYLIEVWDTTLKPGRMISSWDAICDSIFEFGVVLKKGGMKDICISESAKPSKKTTSKKTTKSKPGLSAPIAIPEDGYRNWTLVEEDVTYDKTKYKRFQSHEDALYAFSHRYQDLENAGYLRKNLKLNGTAKWEGDYISDSGRTETIKLRII